MEKIARLLKETPIFSGFDKWSLEYLASLTERKEYRSNVWLFHEFTQREWLGIVEKGEVRIVRGSEEKHSDLAILREGGILSERILLNDLPHSASCYSQEGAIIVQFSRQALERAKTKRPDLYYRIVACVAHLVSDRLRYAAKRPTIENVSYLGTDHGSKWDRDTWSIVGKN